MARFKVLQIVVDRDSDESINTYRDAMMGWTWLTERMSIEQLYPFYSHVADVEAKDEEHAFELMNVWNDPGAITVLGQMHSLSVGDILVDENGDHLFCDSFGFVNFGQ